MKGIIIVWFVLLLCIFGIAFLSDTNAEIGTITGIKVIPGSSGFLNKQMPTYILTIDNSFDIVVDGDSTIGKKSFCASKYDLMTGLKLYDHDTCFKVDK